MVPEEDALIWMNEFEQEILQQLEDLKNGIPVQRSEELQQLAAEVVLEMEQRNKTVSDIRDWAQNLSQDVAHLTD